MGAGAGLFSALAVMLGIAVLARALARRLGLARPAGGRLRMEVVQRLALSPKQGLAVVRIGDRLMTVSMGDGGVRPLLELGEAELSTLAATAPASAAPAPLARFSMDALVPVLAGGISRGITLLRRGARGDAEAAEAAAPSSAPAAEPAQPAAFAMVMMDVMPETAIAHAAEASAEPAGEPVMEREMEIAVPGIVAEPVMEEVAGNVMEAAAEPIAEIVAEPVSEQEMVIAAAAVVETVKPKPVRRRGAKAAATVDADAPARPARTRSKAAARKTAETQARAALQAAVLVLAMLAGALLPARAAAQDVAVPGLAEIARASRDDIGALTQTAAALQQGAQAAEDAGQQRPARAIARPRRPIAGTVQAKADSAFAGAPRLDVSVGQGEDGLKLSGTVGVVVMMGLLSMIPAMVLMMTGFTRILIVLHFVRQALGTQTAPPAHLIGAMALLLTGFVMAPTLGEANRTALQPWLNGQMDEVQMIQAGQQPFRAFMLRQTRESDVALFVELSRSAPPATMDEVPLTVLASAFVTSELRTAFQMGFVLFLPFIVIDLVVASVLMSMGMMMLPPAMIALPFKLLLFVLVDGWALVVQGLVNSFR